MRTHHLRERHNIRPLKFPLSGSPHATVETNRTCNIRCANCYNLDREQVKLLADIKKEIDALAARRNLQALTILGGEPTLHPDLVEIVSYIKSRDLRCQILTNGIAFLDSAGDLLLDRLCAARTDRTTLHVDHGQCHVHKDIERVRTVLFEKLEARRMHFSLSITIDGPDRAVIPELAKKYAHYRHFDGVLAVLARDSSPTRTSGAGPGLEDEYDSISKRLGVEPCAFVPSNLDEQDVRWLMYYYFVNSRTLSAFSVSPAMYSLYSRMYRLFAGRHLFLVRLRPFIVPLAFLFTALIQTACAPKKFPSFLHCLCASSFLRAIRLHYIAIQVPPEFDEAAQAMRMCFNCPDATMRNGMLMPVCLADLMSAPGSAGEIAGDKNPRYDSVRKHLGSCAVRS